MFVSIKPRLRRTAEFCVSEALVCHFAPKKTRSSPSKPNKQRENQSCTIHDCNMQRLTNLPTCAAGFLAYSASPSFPSLKARELAQSVSGITLSRSTGNHLFVFVRVNNRPAWFAVDPGAPLSIVDSNKAKDLGLARSSGVVEIPKQIEVNNRGVPVAIVDSLYVGSENLGSGPVALINLRDFRAKLRGSGNHVSTDGILGLDILQRYKAVIDCHNQRIFLETPGTNPRVIVQNAKNNRD